MVQRKKECNTCQGTGVIVGAVVVECPRCGGVGYTWV